MDDESVLGAVPEIPDDVWDRLLTATFTAPPGDDDLDLLPAEPSEEPDADWTAPVEDGDFGTEHHDAAEHDSFEPLPIDDDHDVNPADPHHDL